MRVLILLCCVLPAQAAAISSAQSGVWGNTALAAGGAYMTTSDTIRSTTCDWTATKDNDLYDIVVGLLLYYSKANNATFTCGATGC